MRNIRNKLLALDLHDVIELTGFETDTDKWFRYFDVYAITSREEGLPVSLLEAMSYGLPIVATNVGAISTVLKSGAVGTIVPPGNAEKFADAVEFYLENKEYASEHGRQSRKRVEMEYSIKTIASQYENWYMDLLAQRGR
jgi:glycosyltransferase involved in cell wall biosynthesis